MRLSVCLGVVLVAVAGCGPESRRAKEVGLYGDALIAYGHVLPKIGPCVQRAATRAASETCFRHWATIDDRAAGRAIAAGRAFLSDVKGDCHAAIGKQVAALVRIRRLQARTFADGAVSSPRLSADLNAFSRSVAPLRDNTFKTACRNMA